MLGKKKKDEPLNHVQLTFTNDMRTIEQIKEDRKGWKIIITSVALTVIATAIAYFLKYDVYKWWILESSIIFSLTVLLLFEDREKLNETSYFIKNLIALISVTYIISSIICIILLIIHNLIFN